MLPCTVIVVVVKFYTSFLNLGVDQKYVQSRNSFTSSHREQHSTWHKGGSQETLAEFHMLPRSLSVSFKSCEREEKYPPGGARLRSESASSSPAWAVSQKLPAPDTFIS